MNKRIIGVIGDIHGSDRWIQIIKDNPQVEQWIFLGDYVDSKIFSNVEILHNLKEIITYKEEHPQTILLIGNHDFQYMFGQMGLFKATGFSVAMYNDYYDLFSKHRDKFQFAYQIDNYLFSHAGVSMKWWNKYSERFIITNRIVGDESCAIPDLLSNARRVYHLQCAMWEVGPERSQFPNDENFGSPIWADFNETRMGALRGYIHVVGHTPQTQGVKYFKVDNTTGIWYCDALAHKLRNHLILEINEN